ncbi:MAG: hypothetical protein NXI04_01610 [Planctomycetaceae bacterium]|nr:hypothetical protein [Planctomycetaceae bacterium]
MSRNAIYRLQFEAAALYGLLCRRMGVTIDLPYEVVPVAEDESLPSDVSNTMSELVLAGLCHRHGLCTSIRESNHAGIIRRYMLDNRPAAEARLEELKRSLGSAYIQPTREQLKRTRPRDLHLPMRSFTNALFG